MSADCSIQRTLFIYVFVCMIFCRQLFSLQFFFATRGRCIIALPHHCMPQAAFLPTEKERGVRISLQVCWMMRRKVSQDQTKSV